MEETLSSDAGTTLDELRALNDLAETAEDFALVERRLLALEQADIDTARQKATCEQLTQQALAVLLGISTKHIRDQQPPSRNGNGTYHGPESVQWLVGCKIKDARTSWERESDSIKTSKERQAEARAIKLEEEAKGVQGAYVLRSEVQLEFMEMAAAVRTELEALPKAMATDFPKDVRDDLIREMKNQTKQILRRLANRGSKFDANNSNEQ